MRQYRLPMPLLVAVLLVSGCGQRAAAPPSAGQAEHVRLPASNATASKLNKIAEKYYDDYTALHPLAATALGDHRYDDRFGDYASITWMADGLAIEQETLAKLDEIDPKSLDADELLTYETLRWGRKINVEGYSYPAELLPFDAMPDLPGRFALLGTGQDVQPFRTARDYDNFLARMDGFVAWVDQAINDLRSGVAKGVVYPRPVIERMLPALEALAVADPTQSLFWNPILNFPAMVPATDRQRLTAAYRDRLATKVLPAYRRLHDYLQKEYLPQARTKRLGMDALPSGDRWYAWLVRYYTQSDLTPQAVHEFGLREVARERANAERLMRQAGHVGDLRSWFDAIRADPGAYFVDETEALSTYGAVRDRVVNAMPLLFAESPRIPLEIRAVEPLRAKFTAAATYRPPPADGKGPGVLYVNTTDVTTRPKYLVETSFLHEALPGHHLQAAIAIENARLPRLRRFGDEFPFKEGWSLYAQTLGRDLGLYGDAYSAAGNQMTQLWMAARVVVDTGLHSKGWTREQAIEYLRANSALPEPAIEADVDHSLALPGRLLACKAAHARILELRARAQEKLGGRFDIREFHTQVLNGGSLPLPVLENKIDRWLSSSLTRPAGTLSR